MVEEVLQGGDDSYAKVTCSPLTAVTGRWPYEEADDLDPSRKCPDIIICTPALLGSFVKGPRLLEPAFYDSLRVVVLDEVSAPNPRTGGRGGTLMERVYTFS